MLALRPRDQTITVALSTTVATVAVATATQAWVAGPLFGLLFLLRFALQPPAGTRLTRRRRAMLACLGCASLGCLVWAIGVRIAHWPG